MSTYRGRVMARAAAARKVTSGVASKAQLTLGSHSA